MNDLPAQSLNQLAWGIYEHASNVDEVPPALVEAAIAATEKAIEESPNQGAIQDTLAHLLHLSGDLDGAVEAQTKALKNPGRQEKDMKDFLDQLLKEKEKADVS